MDETQITKEQEKKVDSLVRQAIKKLSSNIHFGKVIDGNNSVLANQIV